MNKRDVSKNSSEKSTEIAKSLSRQPSQPGELPRAKSLSLAIAPSIHFVSETRRRSTLAAWGLRWCGGAVASLRLQELDGN
jgi:hypothetical protein